MTGENIGDWGDYRWRGEAKGWTVGMFSSHLRAASFGLISLNLGSHCLETCNQERDLIKLKNQSPYNICKCHVVIALKMLRDRRSPKGQGLLRKEGPPSNIRYFVAKLSIVVIYVPFEKLS